MKETSSFIKNPALTPLNVLIGKWNVRMFNMSWSNPDDVATWQASFEWLDNAFVMWRWEGKNGVPESISIIGRNENATVNTYCLLYYDSRGVSRIYKMIFDNGIWKFWREDSDFFQRFEGKINEEGDVITGEGKNSSDGKKWEHDYFITFTRIQ